MSQYGFFKIAAGLLMLPPGVSGAGLTSIDPVLPELGSWIFLGAGLASMLIIVRLGYRQGD